MAREGRIELKLTDEKGLVKSCIDDKLNNAPRGWVDAIVVELSWCWLGSSPGIILVMGEEAPLIAGINPPVHS